MALFKDGIEAFGTGALVGDMEEWDGDGLCSCGFGESVIHWFPGPEAICRAILAALEDNGQRPPGQKPVNPEQFAAQMEVALAS